MITTLHDHSFFRGLRFPNTLFYAINSANLTNLLKFVNQIQTLNLYINQNKRDGTTATTFIKKIAFSTQKKDQYIIK